MEEQTVALREQLAGRYGGAVAVEYLDVYSGSLQQYPEVYRVLTAGKAPLPITCLNGEPTLAGGISFEMIDEELRNLGLTPVEAAQ